MKNGVIKLKKEIKLSSESQKHRLTYKKWEKDKKMVVNIWKGWLITKNKSS